VGAGDPHRCGPVTSWRELDNYKCTLPLAGRRQGAAVSLRSPPEALAWNMPSSCPPFTCGYRAILHANLLVVNMHVINYKLARESSEIFQGPWHEGTWASQTAWVLAGGHDLFRVLRPPLAANRGRTAYHHDHATPHLRGVRGPRGERGAGSRRRIIRETSRIAALPEEAVGTRYLRARLTLLSKTGLVSIGRIFPKSAKAASMFLQPTTVIQAAAIMGARLAPAKL